MLRPVKCSVDLIGNDLLRVQIRLSVLRKKSHFYHYFEEKKGEVNRENLVSPSQAFKSDGQIS